MADIFYIIFALVLLNVWTAAGVVCVWAVMTDDELQAIDECTRPIDMVLWPIIILSLLLKRHEDRENVKKT